MTVTSTRNVRSVTRNRSTQGVNTQLPARGKGFRSYSARWRQYGTAATVRSLQRIAGRYNDVTGKTLEIGSMSKKGGGHMAPHSSHKRGIDADIRPPSKNGGPTTWRSGSYDRAATRRLIAEIRRENPRAKILFNDPVLIREGLTRPYRGHDNHLHVSLR